MGFSVKKDSKLHFPSFFVKAIFGTEVPAYSDTLGTWEKCHCKQIVTVTRGSFVTNQSFGTCQKCHCKRGVTVNSVTVSGEICINGIEKSCFLAVSLSSTDLPAYSDTVYSDTPLTVTLLACPK